MIRPASEIEYPPSPALRNRATMLARMEELNRSSKALMAIISERIGAELSEDLNRVSELSAEQDRLLDNMREMVRAA